MKAEVIYIRSMYLGEAGDGVEISEVCEVLLFECSLPDQEAVVIPYKNSETIILKKGDIRTCFHDAKMHLISFDLSKPLEIGLLNGHCFTTLTLKLEQDGNPLHIKHKRRRSVSSNILFIWVPNDQKTLFLFFFLFWGALGAIFQKTLNFSFFKF